MVWRWGAREGPLCVAQAIWYFISVRSQGQAPSTMEEPCALPTHSDARALGLVRSTMQVRSSGFEAAMPLAVTPESADGAERVASRARPTASRARTHARGSTATIRTRQERPPEEIAARTPAFHCGLEWGTLRKSAVSGGAGFGPVTLRWRSL